MNHKRIITDITVALVGGILSVILQISYKPEILSSMDGIIELLVALMPAIFTGAMIGFLLGKAYDLRKTASELELQLNHALEQLEVISGDSLKSLKSFFRRDPYSMMITSTPHSGILGTLIKESVSSGYKKIYHVDANKYLLYLKEAISHASIYEGIQRHPIRWFKENSEGQNYLKELRDRGMEKKRRVFVISEAEKREMVEDLQNTKLINYYWETTGTSVETFWITEADLKNEYYINSPIDDCAFYDNHLLIKYNPNSKILEFDIEPDEIEVKIFWKLDEQLKAGRTKPFQIIRPVEMLVPLN